MNSKSSTRSTPSRNKSQGEKTPVLRMDIFALTAKILRDAASLAHPDAITLSDDMGHIHTFLAPNLKKNKQWRAVNSNVRVVFAEGGGSLAQEMLVKDPVVPQPKICLKPKMLKVDSKSKAARFLKPSTIPDTLGRKISSPTKVHSKPKSYSSRPPTIPKLGPSTRLLNLNPIKEQSYTRKLMVTNNRSFNHLDAARIDSKSSSVKPTLLRMFPSYSKQQRECDRIMEKVTAHKLNISRQSIENALVEELDTLKVV